MTQSAKKHKKEVSKWYSFEKFLIVIAKKENNRMTDAQQRLDRNLRLILGENSMLIKIYKHEEVMDLLIAARTKDKATSIEFNGTVEDVCRAKLTTARFRVETFQNSQNIVVTVVSW